MHKAIVLMLSLCVIAADDAQTQVDISNPKTAHDYYARGLKREKAKKIAGALADYQKAGQLDPHFFDAHFSQSSLLAGLKEYRAAIRALTASLKARPKSYSALFNRGLYHENLREFDDAIADYTLALAEDADFTYNVSTPEECRAHAHHYRGRAYQWYKKDYVKAIADFTAAIRLDSTIERVLYRRGQAYHSVKEFAKAHRDFEQAVKQDPEYPNLLNAWAWQLATCPDAKYRDGPLALHFAKRTKHLDTLAAAYAETGQFDDAIATQQRAIEQLDRQQNWYSAMAAERRTKLKAEMQKRLTTYQAKRPFRDE